MTYTDDELRFEYLIAFIVKWSGTISMLIGATVFTTYVNASLHMWPFIFFLYAHIAWTIAGVVQKDKPLWIMNLALIPLDAYAFLIRLQ